MENKKSEERGAFFGIGEAIKERIEERRRSPLSIVFDLCVFIVGFLFARCHIVFGVRPLGLAFVAFLPRGVWSALLGVVCGSLSLGRTGVIYAIISLIVTFLRVIISGGEGREGKEKILFCEPLILRVCSAAIGAFVGGVYEVLLAAFSVNSILYGSVGVLLCALFTLLFSGILEGGISFSDFLFSKRDIFRKRTDKKERGGVIIFQCALSVFIFLISLSLKDFSVLGISPVYIFATVATLFAAKRFDMGRAVAVGFFATLAVSEVYSVSFALIGVGAALLFKINVIYAVIGGGVLLSVWSAYVGGLVGFLTVFPEYVVGALISLPFLRKLNFSESEQSYQDARNETRQMVTTTALAYKNSAEDVLDALECSLLGVAVALREFGAGEGAPEYDEYKDAVLCGARSACRECEEYGTCLRQTPAPCAECIDTIATKLYKKQKIVEGDISTVPAYCTKSGHLLRCIEEGVAKLIKEKMHMCRAELCAEEYELFSKLISEARAVKERECAQDKALSSSLEEVLSSAGLEGGTIKVFGERKRHIIGAAEDADGKLITSPKIKDGIEKSAGIKLGNIQYYRKNAYALFECSAAPMYSVDCFSLLSGASKEEVSGDNTHSFESVDGHFYAVLSDGMGSGELAHRVSRFACDFLSKILNSSCNKSTALHILNHAIKERGCECSATVDLFDLDLLTGEATFFKCGAAASYVKRASSVFRIRSETAPIGVMKTIDAERIRVEIKGGDYVILLSDGISQSLEDASWLLEILSKPYASDARGLCERIMHAALEKSVTGDDMSVSVLKINSLISGDKTA